MFCLLIVKPLLPSLCVYVILPLSLAVFTLLPTTTLRQFFHSSYLQAKPQKQEHCQASTHLQWHPIIEHRRHRIDKGIFLYTQILAIIMI